MKLFPDIFRKRFLDVLGVLVETATMDLLASKPAPFQMVQKKESEAAHKRLADHVEGVAQDVSQWVAEAAREAPVLQRAGFQLEWLKAVLGGGQGCLEKSTSESIQRLTNLLGTAVATARKVSVGTPDAIEQEAQFLQYMQAKGAKLVSGKAEVDKQRALLEKHVMAAQVKETQQAKLLADSAELSRDITSITLAYALVCCLRNPAIRNPKETSLRKNLAMVLAQVEEDAAATYLSALSQEAREVLQLPAAGSNAVEAGKDAAAACDAAGVGEAKAKKRRMKQ